MLMYGFQPRSPTAVGFKQEKVKAARNFLEDLNQMIEHAKRSIRQSQDRARHYADPRRCDVQFSVGEKVYLRVPIDFKTLKSGVCAKLSPRFLLNRTIDVVLYVDRLDGYRVDNLDKQVMKAIGQSFGPQIWRITLLVLTHAQLSPPDGVTYLEYVEKRSAALQTAIRQVSGFQKAVSQVVLVENSGRCNTNAGGEKILPDGKVWLPHLFESIVEVATGENQSLVIDKKLIEGPNANQRGKIWIPLLLVTQFFLVVRPILKAIQKDIQLEKQNRPGWEIRAEQYAKSASARRARKKFMADEEY
ncbi:hypothetical protein O6H91_Y399200 [Diphasiastrum complanatum]|nr:hypothetical protein O6H91_Y399200 [Diphasiastrum complanatum]